MRTRTPSAGSGPSGIMWSVTPLRGGRNFTARKMKVLLLSRPPALCPSPLAAPHGQGSSRKSTRSIPGAATGCEANSESPLICPRCSSKMRVLAVITNPAEVKKILRCLIKIGCPPLGRQPSQPKHGTPCGGETAGAPRLGSRCIQLMRPPPQRFTHFGKRERTVWLFAMRPEIV